jgi:hypothetical protein
MSASQAASPTPAAQPQKLDELMMAMDVVDTIRHRELMVEREMGEGARDEALRKRLREIYQGQGLEVTDRIIDEGIKALKESRFVYTPPAPSFNRTLAYMWVARGRIGTLLGVLVAAIVIGWAGYQFGVLAPRERAAEAARIELTETLPKSLKTPHDAIMAMTQQEGARNQANGLLAAGQTALHRGDTASARKAAEGLRDLQQQLEQTYQLRIVSRPGEDTGVFRIPDVNESARNYYLIVEAIGPDGRAINVPIYNEEEGKTVSASKWGVRVSEDIFERVKADKSDDGIVQNAVLGEKIRGELEPRYSMPVLGGKITSW